MAEPVALTVIENPDFPHSELAATNIIKHIMAGGYEKLERALDLPPIDIARFEFPLPCGRADLVLFHNDGTVTVIELKGPGDDRKILAGIGQVTMYAVQIGYARTARCIRKILAAPVKGEDSEHLAEACAAAGVRFVPLGTPEEHAEIWSDAERRMGRTMRSYLRQP